MSRRRVHATIRASTQARAITHRDTIISFLTNRPIYTQRDLDPIIEQDELGVWQARFMLRFESSADADAVYAAIVSRINTNNQVASGSVVSWHDCTHEEAIPRPCVEQGVVVRP
jgi:hypothetical protein